jgi:tetratricopeptide (TPR) repeat protein
VGRGVPFSGNASVSALAAAGASRRNELSFFCWKEGRKGSQTRTALDMRQFGRIGFTAVFIMLVALIAATGARGSVPIKAVYGKGVNRIAMKLWRDAEEELKNGDVENAHRNVDAALRSDPTLWPALYTRAKVFIRQHKYELAIQDCSEALRQSPTFIEAALLRADANAALGRYAASLKEIDHVIAIRPRSDALGRALSDRAWLRSTCPDPCISEWRAGNQRRHSGLQVLALGRT